MKAQKLTFRKQTAGTGVTIHVLYINGKETDRFIATTPDGAYKGWFYISNLWFTRECEPTMWVSLSHAKMRLKLWVTNKKITYNFKKNK